MSSAVLSHRSSTSNGDVRSSRRDTHGFDTLERKPLPPFGRLEHEQSSQSLPRTMSREASGLRHVVGTVEPWNEPEPEPEPGGPDPGAPIRKRPSSASYGSESKAGHETPPELSSEGTRLSTRPTSAATSYRSRGSGTGTGAGGWGLHCEGPGQPPEDDQEELGGGRGGVGREDSAPPLEELEEEEQLPEMDSADQDQEQLSARVRHGAADSLVSKSEGGSRTAFTTDAPEPEPSGRSSSRTSSRRGNGSSARAPSSLGHRGGPGGGGGGSSSRPNAPPLELQDLPPEALPWSEPPEYPSNICSTVSVNDSGIGLHAPPALPLDTSRSSITSSARITGPKPANGRGKQPPVEVPALPLRELASGGGHAVRPTSMSQAPPTPTSSPPPPSQPSVIQPPQPPPPAEAAVAVEQPLAPPPPISREGSRTSVRPSPPLSAGGHSSSHKASTHRSALDIPSHPLHDGDFGTPSGAPPLEPPQPGHESPRPVTSRNESRISMRPSSAASANSLERKTPFARKSATDWHEELLEPLPWSSRSLADFRASLKKASFLLPDAEDPLAARMDAVFALPPELWPVLPPGALYCLEAFDPRAHFGYLQHCDFPSTKVRVNTYFGKWGRHLVDFVVAWQPTPRAEAAWQLADGKQPPLPWEPRQVVAHTTQGEYQYANTRMRFRGPKSTAPDAEMVEWSDAHGVDLTDTKAAHETAPRNSDKDRDAHLIDPPRPNTWGELARRPLISNLRSRGGGTYVHHINYDHSGLRTTCGRRVPAGYFFTLVPNATPKTPPVPGHASVRASSVERSLAVGGLRANGEGAMSMRIRSVNSPVQALLSTFGDSVSSSKWGAYVGGVNSSVSVAMPGAGSRPSSAGRRRPGSAGAGGSHLPQLQGSFGPSELGAIKSGWSAVGAGPPHREGSRLMAPTSPTLVTLASKQRWRTYDVPFSHPIHSTRAQDLGAEFAVATGRGVRTFSDAAAVLQVAEQELRLPRAFTPGPVVVPTWDDIPRLYAEHMEAARALMPVTELDNYGSSKLHMLLYHLQCAATLEYDRLDAKLLLLPQMARMGRKSVEIDAWLQVIVEHAAYLYDKLDITNRARWRPRPTERPAMRRSVTFAKAAAATTAPLVNPTSSAWCFPDPLMGTSFAHRSALNVSAHTPPPFSTALLPAAAITVEEWAAINKVMDTCRHAVLHDHWVRLRPVMTGSIPADSAYVDSSCANSVVAASSNAGATASGEGDRLRMDGQDPYCHGSVNRELLDYVLQDLEAMSSPGYVPPQPAPVKAPKVRGYRGDGPLPPELAAEMPTVHRPVRCRGADETPLPPELQSMDLWNVRNKAEQVDASKGGADVPSPRDAGALRFSQVSVHRLQAAKGFADSRRAEVRRSMQRAMGVNVFDDNDVPEYGSDVADDDAASIATSISFNTVDGRPRRRRHPTGPIKKVEPVVPGIACQTSEAEMPHWEDQQELDESRSRMTAEAAEARRLLLTGNGGRTREQILEDALKSAECAIESLKPRPIGATPLSEPDSPTTYRTGVSMDSVEAAWRPYGRGPDPYSESTVFAPVRPPMASSQDQYKRNPQPPPTDVRSRGGASVETFNKGPEPFSLEKLNAEPSMMSEPDVGPGDIPRTNAGTFGGGKVAIGGLVDYETAMARRRAIAGAEVAQDRSNFVPKSEVLNLFVTYCNLGGHPELIEMLQKAVEAPVSTVTVSAVTKAVSAVSRNATTGHVDVDSEATRQRIRGTAWLLGVTWRRISNETYTSFLCRVLGWPSEVATSLHRTRATQLIARALVRGHDYSAVPKAPPRH